MLPQVTGCLSTGGRSSTGRETVLPRQKTYPACVVSSPCGEVALPCQRTRRPHSARQSSGASSARRRALSAVGLLLGPTHHFPFSRLPGRPPGRQADATGRLAVCSLSPSSSAAHSRDFAVATATQFRRLKRSRLAGIGAPSPPSGSDHSAATEEPAQSVTLPPPTSPHAIM